MSKVVAALVVAAGLGLALPAAAQMPEILQVQPPFAPTQGGVMITIFGQDFGPGPGVVEIGDRPTFVSGPDWTPDRIVLPVPEGDPGVAPVRVVPAGGASSPPWFGFSYLPPRLVSIVPPSGPARGGVPLTIHGENFGTSAVEAWARMGGKIALCTRISHQELEVTTPTLPPGESVDVQVEIHGEVSNPLPFQVEPPRILSVDPPRAPTTGGVLITIHGVNFGHPGEDPEPIVRLDGIVLTATARLEDGMITAEAPPGAGSSRQLSVHVGNVVSPPSTGFGYQPPLLSNLVPPEGPAAGGVRLTIMGQDFGPPGVARQLRLGPANGGIERYGVIDEGATTHVQLVADLPPLDPGDYDVQLLVVDQWSNLRPYRATASPPEILALSSTHGPTVGGVPLTISGTGFGSATGVVELGPWSCPIDAWADEEIACHTPAGYSGPFRIVVKPPNNNPSAGVDYTYDPPHLVEVDPSYLSPAGGVIITLRGENFGLQGSPLVARLGGQELAIVEWRGHHEILVASVPGDPGTISQLCVVVPGSGLGEDCRPVEFGSPVGVEPPRLPAAFGLRLAGPNPSRGATAFAVDLPADARWRLDVFDPAGRLVRRLASGSSAAGTQVVTWDGADLRGGRAAAGLYWARLEVAGQAFVRKAIRL